MEGGRGGGWGRREPKSSGGREVYGRREKKGQETAYPLKGGGGESGEIGHVFRNVLQYFAIEKAHKVGNH